MQIKDSKSLCHTVIGPTRLYRAMKILMNMAGSLPWQRCSPVLPASLAKHPQTWMKEEVGVWLRWCVEEFSIEHIPPEKFDLNGKALCLLSRSDFMERVPKNGDVLYNCLQSLIAKHTGESLSTGFVLVPSNSTIPSVMPQPHSSLPYPRSSFVPSRSPTYINIPSRFPIKDTVTSIIRPSIQQADPMVFPGPSSILEQTATHSLESLHQERSSDCRLLWEFIYQLLSNSKYSSYVCWEDKDDYVFRIINPTGLAELWGQQKNRTNMTYEKLSRALRYYYRMNIIKKVPGKRLTYRFLQPPTSIQKGQRGAKPQYKVQMELMSGRISTKLEKTDPETGSTAGQSSTIGYSSAAEEASETSERDIEEFDVEDEDISEDLELESETEKIESPDYIVDTCEQTSKDTKHKWATLSITKSSESVETAQIQTPRTSPSIALPLYPVHDFLQYGLHRPRHTFTPPVFNETVRPTLVNHENIFFHHQPDYLERDRLLTTATQYSSTESEPGRPWFPGKRLSEKDIRFSESMYRSHSCDFAQSTFPQRLSFRPSQPRSASPKIDVQQEPEDLSMRTRAHSAASSSRESHSSTRPSTGSQSDQKSTYTGPT